jgi:hypothetical protein
MSLSGTGRIRDLPGWPWEPYSIYSSYVDEGLEQWINDPVVSLSPSGPSRSSGDDRAGR